MRKVILNTVSLFFALLINYLFGIGLVNSNTVRDVSIKFDTLFAPSGYAFSIWGLIYILLTCFVIYHWNLFFNGDKFDIIERIGIWFASANIMNGLWIIVWVNEFIGLSVLIMLVLLLSLCMLVKNLNMERWDAPPFIIFFIWWPICIYFGWILLATAANVSAFFVSLKLTSTYISPQIWTIVYILFCTLIYILLIYKRNMREASLVGVWGLIAIAYRQLNVNIDIVITAITCSVILLIYSFYHGYKNRATSPFKKLLNFNKD